jgi:N6-L-threonylcarbamoyladenine synthase
MRIVEPYRLVDDGPEPVSSTPLIIHRPVRFADDLPAADLAAAYQEAVVDMLAVKAVKAARAYDAKALMLAGGVAANPALRGRIRAELAAAGLDEAIRFMVPSFTLSTDNAAMIAGAAAYALKRGVQGGWEVDVSPRLPLR